ncbi:MAG: pyridoxamine 5'-phosphate oxidase family protein [Firmicutes bacterium]|nr:pyridoxamine 5'-phosphate oxidase family protein [Bacillota bacterium]
MFRKMRRFKQEISREECIEVLKNEPRGVLSVLGDDDYPYGLPVSHYYDEETGNIYFHCAAVGHKIDAIAKHDKVSFCVMDKGYRKEGDWALNIKSVIAFGRAKLLEDRARVHEVCGMLTRKFTDDPEYLEKELRINGDRVQVVEITVEHMTGKLVNES